METNDKFPKSSPNQLICGRVKFLERKSQKPFHEAREIKHNSWTVGLCGITLRKLKACNGMDLRDESYVMQAVQQVVGLSKITGAQKILY